MCHRRAPGPLARRAADSDTSARHATSLSRSRRSFRMGDRSRRFLGCVRLGRSARVAFHPWSVPKAQAERLQRRRERCGIDERVCGRAGCSDEGRYRQHDRCENGTSCAYCRARGWLPRPERPAAEGGSLGKHGLLLRRAFCPWWDNFPSCRSVLQHPPVRCPSSNWTRTTPSAVIVKCSAWRSVAVQTNCPSAA